MKTAFTVMVLAVAMTAPPAHAQKVSTDVVVMRRVIAPPNRTRPATPAPTPTPAPVYSGTWSLSPTLYRTTCTAKQRETYYPAICTGPGSVVDTAQSSCNPSTRPDQQRTTSACTSNCEAFRAGFYYSGSRSIGTITGSTEAGKQEAARDLCERTTARISGFSCTLSSSVGSKTGTVSISDSYSDTFVSGPSNFYFTASCRMT